MSFNQINFYKSLGQTKSVNSNKVSPVWRHDKISEDKLENAPVERNADSYMKSCLKVLGRNYPRNLHQGVGLKLGAAVRVKVEERAPLRL